MTAAWPLALSTPPRTTCGSRAFINGEEPSPHEQRKGAHSIPRFLRARSNGGGHRPRSHGALASAGQVDRQGVLDRLSAGRQALGSLAGLTDAQLDAIPPASETRFCDGRRNLEQIATSLLKHQSHQVDAIRSALA